MDYLLYLGLGAVAGLISGLFGLGGGVVIVPILIVSFELQGMAPEISTHMAIGTSLATILVTSSPQFIPTIRKQAIRWDLVKVYHSRYLLGALLGGSLALLQEVFTAAVVRWLFDVVALQTASFISPVPAKCLLQSRCC